MGSEMCIRDSLVDGHIYLFGNLAIFASVRRVVILQPSYGSTKSFDVSCLTIRFFLAGIEFRGFEGPSIDVKVCVEHVLVRCEW